MAIDKNFIMGYGAGKASKTSQTIIEETDAWLEENISQETGYVLDRTLTLQNAAAPADLVGDLKSALDYKGIVNLFDPDDPDVLRGQYYDGTTLKTNASFGQTGFIPVEYGHYYRSSTLNLFVQTYYADKTFRNKYQSTDYLTNGHIEIGNIDIAYCRFMFMSADESDFAVWEVDENNNPIKKIGVIDDVNERIDDLSSTGVNLKFIGGAIRRPSSNSQWALISDSNHVPLNLSSVSVNSSGDIEVSYSFTARRVICSLVSCDETFARLYLVGGSVGKDKITIPVYDITNRAHIDANTIYSDTGNFWLYGVMDVAP